MNTTRRRYRIAGTTAVVAIVVSATNPAMAAFGAVAYDQNTGKYGASFNQPNQSQAFEDALKQCNSSACRVYPVEPKGCGALALSDTDKAWGGADRVTLNGAKHDAVLHCEAHTRPGSCTVRVSGCNSN